MRNISKIGKKSTMYLSTIILVAMAIITVSTTSIVTSKTKENVIRNMQVITSERS